MNQSNNNPNPNEEDFTLIFCDIFFASRDAMNRVSASC